MLKKGALFSRNNWEPSSDRFQDPHVLMNPLCLGQGELLSQQQQQNPVLFSILSDVTVD